MITRNELTKFLPNAKPALVDAVVANWHEAEAAGITTPKRIRQFLSNIAVETGGLTSIVENLNYTSAQRIYDTFKGPSNNPRFKSVAECQPYVRQAKKLAIKVYGGRMGNAPAPSEDGWIFRGGGGLQTSGRNGYRELGFEDNPTALQTNPKIAFLVAVREWAKRGCNAKADKDDTVGVRKAINGGTNGLKDVEAFLVKAKKVWPDSSKLAPKPKNSSITDVETVKAVQKRLYDLGYTEVGGFDGDIGTMTRAAILAFRADNNLPLATVIDDEFMRALGGAKPRQIAFARSIASANKVIGKVPEVKANFLSKVVSAVTAFFSGTVAMVTGVLDQFDDAEAYVDPIKAYAASVPGWVWLLIVAGLALTIFFISRNGEKKGVEAFQTGQRR